MHSSVFMCSSVRACPQYAPSVRALREFAQVVTFPKPAGHKLMNRLKEIAASEGMQVCAAPLRWLHVCPEEQSAFAFLRL